jgi:hypothetical protein
LVQYFVQFRELFNGTRMLWIQHLAFYRRRFILESFNGV